MVTCDDVVLSSSLAKFGSDYDCQWRENNTLLVITLGNGTTIGAETLYLNGEALYTTDSGCPHSYENIEPVIAKYAGVNPKPVALFEVNDSISIACSDLVLDGQSQNIRAIDYTWSLTLDGGSFTTSQSLDTSYVSIPGSSLSEGQMGITLSVKYSPITGFSSAEHDSDTMSKTVTIITDRVLDIRFANLDTFTLSKNTYAEFPVEIVNDSCSSSTSYTYVWSFISGPSDSTIGSVLEDSHLLHKLVVQR